MIFPGVRLQKRRSDSNLRMRRKKTCACDNMLTEAGELIIAFRPQVSAKEKNSFVCEGR